MAISEKIKQKIEKLDEKDEDFKKLLLDILEEESKGDFRYKERFENIINEYLKDKKVVIKDDQN